MTAYLIAALFFEKIVIVGLLIDRARLKRELKKKGRMWVV